MPRRTIAFLMLTLFGLPSSTRALEALESVDLVLRSGTLHLGDGQPSIVGDIAIDDGRIVAVGEFEASEVKHEIDCHGLVVCPGFIDLHNHSDRPILERSTRSAMNYVTQGCTTLVTGNCGSGPIDVAEYYDKIDRFGAGPNVAHLLPQGSLRRAVIGTEQRAATPDELRQMETLAAKAMDEGAWGMTSGLIYVPSSYADTDELVALARIVGQRGGIYGSHIRNENVELLSAIEEALEIGQRANVPVHISHFKSSGKDSWGLVRVASKMIAQAREQGRRITADQYPYAASNTSLEAMLIPTWARAGGQTAMLKRLDDADQGQLIRKAIAEKLIEFDDGQRLQIAYYAQDPSWSGKRIAEIARRRSISSIELALEIFRHGGASVVNHSINEADVRYVMTLPWVATASDGSARLPGPSVPHPRSYGTFPRKIGYYSVQHGVVSIAQAIRSATGLPADILGMSDRGYLRPNYWADVVVFDAKTIRDTATYESPHNYATGIKHVLINGELVVSNGAPTGVLAGRALRREVAGSH